MCSIQTIVTPSARRPRIVPMSDSTSASVSPPAISSSSSSRGRRRERPGQLEPLAVEQRQRPGEDVRLAEQAGPPSSASTLTATASPSARLRPAKLAPTRTFSKTVIAAERPGDLVGAADPEAGPLVGRQAGDVLAVEEDASASGARLPVMRLSIEVLPAPFGPTTPRVSPAARRQRQAVGDDDTAERLVDDVELEQGGTRSSSPRLVAAAAGRQPPMRLELCRPPGSPDGPCC